MSTNYYFKVDSDCIFCKDKTIHIGKRSGGWKPSFERTEFYSSVKEMKEFYEENKHIIKVVNEYDEVLSMKELEKELFDWKREDNNALVNEMREGDYKDKEGYYFIGSEFS